MCVFHSSALCAPPQSADRLFQTLDVPLRVLRDYPPNANRIKHVDQSEIEQDWGSVPCVSATSLKIVALNVFCADPQLPLVHTLQRLSLHIVDGLFDASTLALALFHNSGC
jgi:hypothetical protein